MKALRFTVPGPPRTKKNHGRLVKAKGRLIMMPSKVWSDWCKQVKAPLEQAMQQAGLSPLAQPVNCAAVFYREVAIGDAVGFYQGLADVLEHAGVVQNDRFIVSWDGSRLAKDKLHPRVEVTLTMLEEAPC